MSHLDIGVDLYLLISRPTCIPSFAKRLIGGRAFHGVGVHRSRERSQEASEKKRIQTEERTNDLQDKLFL